MTTYRVQVARHHGQLEQLGLVVRGHLVSAVGQDGGEDVESGVHHLLKPHLDQWQGRRPREEAARLCLGINPDEMIEEFELLELMVKRGEHRHAELSGAGVDAEGPPLLQPAEFG